MSANPAPSPLERRLIFVVGKGGVGKSTVAGALAQMLAWRGKRVLLAQAGGPAPAPRSLPLLPVDGEAAMAEYLALNLPGRFLARRVVRSRLYRRFVAVAPGLKELMAVGKLAHEERRRDTWDAVVVDCPATGHGLELLRMPAAAHDAFRAGRIQWEAERVLGALRDPARTAVCLVTLPEELPVRETLDAIAELERLELPLGVLFVNRVHDAPLAAEEIPAAPAGAPPEVVAALRCAREEAARTARDRAHVARLRAAVALPTVLLPNLYAERFGDAERAALAARLAGAA